MPELLTSWTRLIAVNWRDPLVGLDVLIGVLAAGGYIAVVGAGTTLLVLLNSRVQLPRQFFPWAIASFTSAFATIPWNVSRYLVNSLGADLPAVPGPHSEQTQMGLGNRRDHFVCSDCFAGR
jgi:hypothetical protein